MDKRQLIAALVEKTGVKLDEDDPAFLLVDLNLMVLESRTSLAADQLARATQEFNAVTTRNVDDFVAVANEALSKFMQRTTELKSTLEGMALGRQVVLPADAMATAVPVSHMGQAAKPLAMLWWLAPLIFAFGLVVGLYLSLLLGK